MSVEIANELMQPCDQALRFSFLAERARRLPRHPPAEKRLPFRMLSTGART